MEPENTPFSEKEMFIYKSPNLGIHWLVFAGVVVLRKQFILMSAHLKLRGLLRPWPMVSIFFACFQTRIWNPDIVNSVYINRWLNLYENIEKNPFHTISYYVLFHIISYLFNLLFQVISYCTCIIVLYKHLILEVEFLYVSKIQPSYWNL